MYVSGSVHVTEPQSSLGGGGGNVITDDGGGVFIFLKEELVGEIVGRRLGTFKLPDVAFGDGAGARELQLDDDGRGA